MDFKQLRSFVTIVDHRNFSKSAEKLNIAQSSVSTHLMQLEKELGVRLVNRTTKSIEITDAGFNVYKYASRILELEERVRQSCSADGHCVLHIGATAIPAAFILPDALQHYRELCPNDCIKVMEYDSQTVVEGVLSGRFHAGLTDRAVNRGGIKCSPLCTNQPILITPVTDRYLKMKQQRVPVAELLNEPFVICNHGVDLLPEPMGIHRDNLKIVARLSDYETVKRMVAGGMGASVIPEVAARDMVKYRNLLAFEITQVKRPQKIYLVYPEDSSPKDRVWNFVDDLLLSNI